MDFFKKNKIALILALIGLGVLIMWGRAAILRKGGLFGRKTEEPPGEVIPVKATKAAKMDYKEIIPAFGTIKGFTEIPISFKETGILGRFYFKEGDEIKKGDIVVSQEQKEEKLRLEYASIDYQKDKSLYELGAITKDALRQSELEMKVSEAELEKRNFYAPSGGFMGTRRLNEGELTEPSDVAATFIDIEKVFCEVGIIEKDMGKVKRGQKAKVVLETFPGHIFEGKVDSVSPMVEGRSRTQTVRILVPNEEYSIKPGMFARTEITVFEKKDAIVVPKKALHKKDKGYVVFGINRGPRDAKAPEDGITAEVIAVEVERATEKLALIRGGLEEGREIVLESPKAKEGIQDGARIEIIGTE